MRFMACALSAVLFGGCTTSLDTHAISSAGGPAEGAIGMTYALPAVEDQLTITRTLTKCETKGQQVIAEFDVKVEARPVLVDGEWFAVDYRQLANWTKTSSFEIETYENQTLKTFNVKADDKSIGIIVGVAKAGFSIARLVMGLPGAPVESDVPLGEPRLTCPTAKLGQLDQLSEKLEAATEELTASTTALDAYTVTALIGTLTESDKQKISELREKIGTQKKAAAEIQKKIDEIANPFTFSETATLTPTAKARDLSIPFPSEKPEVKTLQMKWLKGLFGAEPNETELKDIRDTMQPLVATVRPRGPIETAPICDQAGVKPSCRVTGAPRWNEFVSSTADARPVAIPGIAYRPPLRTTLKICRGENPEACAEGSIPALVSNDQLTPQLGRLTVLPFINGFGNNNELSATFRADGSLEKASYGDKRAVGEAAVNALNNVLGQGLSLADAVRAKRAADLAKEKVAETEAEGEAVAALTKQVDEAKKQKELLELQAALDPASLEASRQLAVLNAQIAQLNAQKTIKELEAALNPPADEED